MLGKIIDEVLSELKNAEQHQEKTAADTSEPKFEKISEEMARELKSRLEFLGLGKYAAFVDSIDMVAAEFVNFLLDELEKVASDHYKRTGQIPFRTSDEINKDVLDPISKFALS